MNPQGQMQNGGLLPEDKLIKPGQVQNLGFLTMEQKQKYHDGIEKLWRNMHMPPGSDEKMEAWQRLSELSTRLKTQMLKWKQENGQPIQGGQIRPGMMGQQDPTVAMQQAAARQMLQQQQQQRQQQQQQQQQQPSANPEYSAHVRQEATNFQPAIPPDVRQRSPEEQKQWVNGQKRSYAVILQTYEQARNQMQQLTVQVNARRQERPLNPNEQQAAANKHRQITAAMQEAQSKIVQFKRQHDQMNQHLQAQQQAQQQQTQQRQPQVQPTTQPSEEQLVPQKQEPTDLDNAVQIKTENEGTDAQVDGATRPSTGVQEPKPPPVQTQPSQPTTNAPPAPLQNTKAAGPAPIQQTSPQTSQPGSGPAPYPLTHQAAISRAQSYNQSSTPSHGHPATQTQSQNIQREQPPSTNTMNQRPANRPLNVPPLAAASMPPARPSMAGGQGPVGSMGQPALQTYPGFLLQGEGDHVLSKNKLQELVREVTGGAGGEGSDTLDPEVEEVSEIKVLGTRQDSIHLIHLEANIL